MQTKHANCSQDGIFKKKISFTSVSNVALRDKNLSIKAKGLYSIIQSYITLDNFTLYKSFLIEQSTDGIRSFNSGWEELKTAGYIKQMRIRVEKGFTYEYELLDEPDLDTPATVNIRMDGSIVENNNDTRTTFDDIKNQENNTSTRKNNVCLDIEVENEVDDEITDTEINITTQKIKKQIDYEKYISEGNPHIDNLLNLMLEIATTQNTSIKIGEERISIADIRIQFSKIDRLCIHDILKSLNRYDKPIKNPRLFLLKTLYNAPKTASTRVFSENKTIQNFAKPKLE